MDEHRIKQHSGSFDFLLAALDQRDAVLWLRAEGAAVLNPATIADLVGLPWTVVVAEGLDDVRLAAIERPETADDPLVRRRGLVHLIDADPNDVQLPLRSLPVFLLNGRAGGRQGLAARSRRDNMLLAVARTRAAQLIVLSGPTPELPGDLTELWTVEGFFPTVTLVGQAEATPTALARFEDKISWPGRSWWWQGDTVAFAAELVQRYVDTRGDRVSLRIRSVAGGHRPLDVSGLDDPEHPLLANYSLITEKDLTPVQPEELTADDVNNFFKDVTTAWKAYAAGLPWERDHNAWPTVRKALRRLDRSGAVEVQNFLVLSEPGAGATTFVRMLAFEAARDGYPALVAGTVPFTPNGRSMVQYITRVLERAREAAARDGTDDRLYEVPFLIAFDRMHWDGREAELMSFVRELERSGRRAVVLCVPGPRLGLAFYGDRRFPELTHLSHDMNSTDAVALGRHLARYLRHVPNQSEWERFHQASGVHASVRIASFWIALSFWVQRQFDLSETVQAWIWRRFGEAVRDPAMKLAIVRIAALATEHQPLPEELLPTGSEWPVSALLGDLKPELAPLGLVQIRTDGERFWALTHDVLGRYLLSALFNDPTARAEAGFAEAQNPEHLRFLALREIARQTALDRRPLRPVAEAFATTIFKIDPERGHAAFVVYWREVLEALDEMPRALRHTSRAFLHHTAISRRRIASMAEMFPLADAERTELLERAARDIEAALTIADTSDGETDLNLLNSLGHSYLDLAKAKAVIGAPEVEVAALRDRATECIRRAYTMNPDNSYVVEAWAKNLVAGAHASPDKAVANAIEVLNLVYAAMSRDASVARHSSLSRLADEATNILMAAIPATDLNDDPVTPAAAIAGALRTLLAGIAAPAGRTLADYPEANRIAAAARLAHPILADNPQALRLRYLLTAIDYPYDFALQLDLLEQLAGTASTFSPQFRLEYAILLHQRGRHYEADRAFRDLRQLWAQEEHYVEVPERLSWLIVRDGVARRQVHARIQSGGDGRFRAKVDEMGGTMILFRPQEFPPEAVQRRERLGGYVRFGHNGPFLRPLTAV
ncbi:MAG TPA: hypothetical protein VGN75_10490 [Kaistia sp.]|jgi:hypothetical protein|nr:hypothetical protein [Kaistia sp.]